MIFFLRYKVNLAFFMSLHPYWCVSYTSFCHLPNEMTSSEKSLVAVRIEPDCVERLRIFSIKQTVNCLERLKSRTYQGNFKYHINLDASQA